MKTTGIWKRSLGTNEKPATEKLRASLDSFRDKVKHLTSQIGKDLPHLTIHDITHLDALWQVADTIVGDDFPLNPLEAYIFGGSVLLHDAALCFQAYAGGKQGLRDTVEWKDAYARLSSITRNTEDISREADFEALRNLHASQAIRLAYDPWQAQSGPPVYLIEDSNLRENYGLLIGEIASSHHLDIETVAEKFSSPRPPDASLPSDWVVNPLKIACMLRVADAGHIDGSRAPSFLLKLLEMNSISKAHWIAQNHLGRIMVNPKDSTQLIVASTNPFSENEAAAWWVAFDAIALFDKELRSCNDLLGKAVSGQCQQFARREILGAGKVKELAKHVQTEGWEPTDTKVHVSDVANLIQRLGGAELYGVEDKLEIVIRELIQNSSDAVAAREEFTGESFDKKIVVRLARDARDKDFVLQVDDDGIGMSQKTLTEDLIDFGKSFWKSVRASQEFPGIHDSGFSPAGRFGIGFFSVFMIADCVKVYSRRYDKSLDSVRCLSFSNGLSLRPTLSSRRPEDFGMDFTTRVEIKLPATHIPNPDKMNIRVNVAGHEGIHVALHDYVASLVSGIKTQVSVEWDKKSTQVHGGFPPKPEDRKKWLEALSYVNCGANTGAQDLVNRSAHRLREMRSGSKCYGLAAINTLTTFDGHNFISAAAVGGLVSLHNRSDGAFVGLIEYFPANAKRGVGERAVPEDIMKAWLEEQLRIIKRENLDFIQSVIASYSLSEFDFDPIEILQGILVNAENKKLEYWRLADLHQFLRKGNRLGFRLLPFFPSRLDHYANQLTIPNLYTCLAITNGKFNEAELEAGVPKNPNSLIGIIHRTLEGKGTSPKWIIIKNAYQSLLGNGDCLEVKI